jgi:hypothetical protein
LPNRCGTEKPSEIETVGCRRQLERLEVVKVVTTKIEPMQPAGRIARLDADVSVAFPTDATVNDARRRLMGPQGERRE